MSKIAVIKTGGKQYTVTQDSVIKVEKLPIEAGKNIDFDQVLLVADADGKEIKLGKPAVEGAKVSGTVLEQGRSKKVRVVKYKNKIRYKRVKGHKQAFSKIKIDKIV